MILSIESILTANPSGFDHLLHKIRTTDFYNKFHAWCIESTKKNPVFKS